MMWCEWKLLLKTIFMLSVSKFSKSNNWILLYIYIYTCMTGTLLAYNVIYTVNVEKKERNCIYIFAKLFGFFCCIFLATLACLCPSFLYRVWWFFRSLTRLIHIYFIQLVKYACVLFIFCFFIFFSRSILLICFCVFFDWFALLV